MNRPLSGKSLSLRRFSARAACISSLLLSLASVRALALYPDLGGAGACNFINPFANSSDCVQYTGGDWTADSAAEDCATLFSTPYEYQFTQGATCTVPDYVADCVQDIGTAIERVNLNSSSDPAFCGSLEGICNAVLMGEYFPVAGGICDTGPPTEGCDGLEPEACEAMQSNEEVEVTQEETYISFTPLATMAKLTGVIVFPGGAVVPQAYAPLAQELAMADVYTAVLNGPDGTQVDTVVNAPENAGIQNWVLAGHSLGGVVAIKHIIANPGTIAGLGLMGSFPDSVDDMSDLDVKAVTIFATNDMISTPAEVLAGIDLLPANTLVAKIRGGNHSQFGYYGETPGDGDPDTPPEKQLELTAATLRHLVNRVAAGDDVPLETAGRFGLNQLTNKEGARNDFLSASGFKDGGVSRDDIGVQRTASRPEFVASKPSTTPDEQPEIRINQFIYQLGNPMALDFPPIYDGETQAKFETQEAVEAGLGLSTEAPQGSCVDANQDNRARTERWLDDAGLLSGSDMAKLDQWEWIYLPDLLFPTGPEFIADPTSIVTVDIDESARTVSVRSPSFLADLDPSQWCSGGAPLLQDT